MTFFKVGNEEYEIYLSSNGVCNIEERTGKSIADLKSNTGFNTIRLLLWACLWEKNKLTVEETGTLIDRWLLLSDDNTIAGLSAIIVNETKKWTATFSTNKNSKKNITGQ